MPNRSSIGTSAREHCLQGVQCHPGVPKHHPTDVKPVSPQYSFWSSARGPCPQCPQCYPRVSNQSCIDPSAREPCLQASQRQIALRGEANLTSPSKRICPTPTWNGYWLARCFARGSIRQPTPASAPRTVPQPVSSRSQIDLQPRPGSLPFSGADAACNCLPPQRCRYSNRVLAQCQSGANASCGYLPP